MRCIFFYFAFQPFDEVDGWNGFVNQVLRKCIWEIAILTRMCDVIDVVPMGESFSVMQFCGLHHSVEGKYGRHENFRCVLHITMNQFWKLYNRELSWNSIFILYKIGIDEHLEEVWLEKLHFTVTKHQLTFVTLTEVSTIWLCKVEFVLLLHERMIFEIVYYLNLLTHLKVCILSIR